VSETRPPETRPPESAQPISGAKLAANRANARQSTGPRTEDGKARSSRNAVKHGLFSRAPAEAAPLTEQEQADLDALVLDGRQRYRPRGAEEEAAADRLAALWFELQRTSAGRERYWRARLDAGDSAEDATRHCAAQSARERQLERSIRQGRQDLVFLQRLRDGELCRHRREELREHDRLLALLNEEQERAAHRIADLPRAPAVAEPPRSAAPPNPPADEASPRGALSIDPATIPHAARALALLARAGLPVDDPPPALPPRTGPSGGTGRRPEVPRGSGD
jgi:hypothetical protein